MEGISVQNSGITQSIISEVFAVSRSAVSQSCKKRSIEDDVARRIEAKFLVFLGSQNTSSVHIQGILSDFLADVRMIMGKRAEKSEKSQKKKGRPVKLVNFRVLKALARAISNKILEKFNKIAEKVEKKSDFIDAQVLLDIPYSKFKLDMIQEGVKYIRTNHTTEKTVIFSKEDVQKFASLPGLVGIKDHRYIFEQFLIDNL